MLCLVLLIFRGCNRILCQIIWCQIKLSMVLNWWIWKLCEFVIFRKNRLNFGENKMILWKFPVTRNVSGKRITLYQLLWILVLVLYRTWTKIIFLFTVAILTISKGFWLRFRELLLMFGKKVLFEINV